MTRASTSDPGDEPEPQRPTWTVARVAMTLAIGLVGALIFRAVQLPLPWMLGSMGACLIAAVARAPVKSSKLLERPMRAVLGLAVGTSFTPDLAGRLGEMAVSLAFVAPFVVAIGLIGVPYFVKLAGFDRPTAFYAAMPGGFQDMLILGQEAGGDVRRMSLVHGSRVLVLVFALPFWLQWSGGLDITGVSRTAHKLVESTPREVAILIGCALVGWWLAKRLRVSGAAIIGPMFVTALGSVTGLIAVKMPVEILNLAQLILGAGVGCHFFGVTSRDFFGTVAYGLGFGVILLALTALFTVAVTHVTGLAEPPVLLAFSPGGQAEMNLIALGLSIDVAYVALHHLLRLVLVIIGAQIVGRMLRS